MSEKPFPEIRAASGLQNGENPSFFSEIEVRKTLRKIMPELFCSFARENLQEFLSYFQQQLPFVKASHSEESDHFWHFYMVNKMRADDFKFFFDIFCRWLIPGKRLNVFRLNVIDFKLPQLNGETYTLCELTLSVADTADLAEIERHLPIIETEARIGLKSAYNARRILEVKGLTGEEKTILIQEDMAKLISRLPEVFSRDLFVEMQHVLVICLDAFKKAHSARHLSRMVATHYVFRQSLFQAVEKLPNKRHLRLHVIQGGAKGKEKSSLSIMVGLNFLKEKEVFEEQHLMSAICNTLPDVQAVEGSFFTSYRRGEPICTLYLEVESVNGRAITREEVLRLRRALGSDVRDHIGHLMHPVFMPHNEEEIMRNVLVLSSEVRYLRDIPQVFITFDRQSEHHLFFLAILVRVLSPGMLSLQEMFKKSNSSMEYVHDRCKIVGVVRKKHAKEATIFRIKLDSRPFLRQDNSIDIRRARQEVLEELTRLMGGVRDYNGGMISKQHELLLAAKKLIYDDGVKCNDLLLENFFYSMTPVVMRTVLDPYALKELFLLLQKLIEEGFFNDQDSGVEVVSRGRYAYAIVAAREAQIRQELTRALNKIPRQSASLATAYTQVYGVSCLGYIYCSDDFQDQELFVGTLHETLEKYKRQSLSARSSSF